MDLRLVQTFVRAARLGGFAAAARELGVSPSAVSQNVGSLESQLGVRLFARTTRQIKLTAEGGRFLARCEPALEALQQAAQWAGDEHEAMRGTLRVTSTTAFGRREILPTLAIFQQQYPEVRIEFSLLDEFTDLVGEGFDVAIRGGILPESDHISRLLVPVTPLVCASPSYAAQYGMPQRLDEISSHRCIGLLSNPSQRVFGWEFLRDDVVIRLEIEPRLIINDPEGAALAAIEGMGLAQLGSNLVLPAVAKGRLVLALKDYAVRTRGLYALYPSRKHVPRRVTAFLELLVARFAARPDLIFESLA